MTKLKYTEHDSAFGFGFAGEGWCFCMTTDGMEPIKNLLFAIEQEENSSNREIVQINMNQGDVNNEYNSRE